MKKGRVSIKAIIVMTAFLVSSLGNGAEADQVVFENGDRIAGTLLKLEDGVLTIRTAYAEKLETDAIAVKKIDTDTPVDVRLDSCELLSGPLLTEGEVVKILGGEGREDIAITWSRIVSINVPPPPPWTWKGNVFLGALKQTGNTERTSVTFGGEAVRKSAADRFNLSLLYNYAEDDGLLTARDTYGEIKYDYFLTEKFYGYIAVSFLKDRFKDLNLRTVVGPGVGYQIWDDDIKTLAFEGGLAYFSEDRVDAEDEQWLSACGGFRFRYVIARSVTFSDNLKFCPNLEQGGEYTSRNEATLISSIAGPWSLRLANIWEHDSDPAEGVKKDDSRSSLNLQYSF